MINIAICDDEIHFTGQMDTFLNDITKNLINIDIDIFEDGKELTEVVESGKKFDLLYLDIEMKKIDGISAAKRIRKIDKDVLIIYITSYENYMIKCFDVRPFRFLIKPIENNIYERCFYDAYKEILEGNYYFRFRYQHINWKVKMKDILYFESKKRKIYIITQFGIYTTYGKLNELEKTIKNKKFTFLRVHQSYLVNYDHIRGQGYDHVIMDNGESISISEDKRKSISEQYCMIGDGVDVD